MFLTPLDDVIKRMGSEIFFLEQLTEKQKQELETVSSENRKLKQIVELLKNKVELFDGHQPERSGEIDSERSGEAEGISR